MFEVKSYQEKMQKSLEAYENEVSTVRAGRANPAVLNKITVEYYGTPTAINQVAQVSVPDARTIVIQPWDATTLKSIEKAIMASDLGIQPANDGKVIRLMFPQLTEERRRELSKQISKMGEDAKVAIRNIRRDAKDKIAKAKKAAELTEDDAKKAEKDVQDVTDKFIKMVDAVTEKKSKELMAI